MSSRIPIVSRVATPPPSSSACDVADVDVPIEEDAHLNAPSTSPDDDDIAHVRAPPPAILFPGGSQRYAKLEPPPDLRVQRINVATPITPHIQTNITTRTPQKAHIDTVDASRLPPPPCLSNPLLLCVTLFGAVFILCGILVGISISLQPGREDHVTIYNAAVERWHRVERATFAHVAFMVQVESPEPETRQKHHNTQTTHAQQMQVWTKRRLLQEGGGDEPTPTPIDGGLSGASSGGNSSDDVSTASYVSSSSGPADSMGTEASTAIDTSTSNNQSDSSGPAAGGANGNSTGEGSTSASDSTGASTGANLSSTGVDDSTASDGLSSTSDSSGAGDSTGSSDSTGADSSSAIGIDDSTGPDDSSSTGSADDDSTGVYDSSTGSPSPSTNDPHDPWLQRDRTALVKVTSGDLLNDPGIDVDHYQPLYYGLSGLVSGVDSLDDPASLSSVITPDPTSTYSELPSVLLRNHSHPRRWLDREDFSLNATRLHFVAHRPALNNPWFDDDSALSISLPFLRHDLTKTSASICTTKLHGVYDIDHETCLSFKQLTALCVRVKKQTRDQIIESHRRRVERAMLESSAFNSTQLAWNATRWIFDTDELAGWNTAAARGNEGSDSSSNAGSTDSLSISSSTQPRWTDLLGTASFDNAFEPGLSIPGCTRHPQLGWQVGVYTTAPVQKVPLHANIPEYDGEQRVWQPMKFEASQHATLKFSLAGVETTHTSSHSTGMRTLDGDPNANDADGDGDGADSSGLLLISLDIGAFNLSIRSRDDPYLMAESLTRSSLWFGLPSSELILFTGILIFIGMLLEIAPCYHGARWWTMRKQAMAGELEEDEDEDEEEEDDEDDDAADGADGGVGVVAALGVDSGCVDVDVTVDSESLDLSRGGVDLTEITITPTDITRDTNHIPHAKKMTPIASKQNGRPKPNTTTTATYTVSNSDIDTDEIELMHAIESTNGVEEIDL